MTADELAAMIAEEIDNNSSARAILAKVQRGTATLADSERFTGITAEITGRLLADNVLSLPLSDRQGAFVDITAARYRDTFSVFSAVQRVLDERLGINLAVMDPGFEKARAQKAGHALADQTVPESTVVRRAESAGENIVRSQHDRIVQKQAEFRDRAGLQCSAIREGGAKCCEWCASVSGKYPASDTPQGFWGRHDNCKCSILYETRKGVQRLGGSTKKWEPLEDAGTPEPTRLTAEQAVELEARHPVIAFSPEQAASLQEAVLTNGRIPAIIELPDIEIGRSVGAKAKNYDIMDLETGEHFSLAEGTSLRNVQVFAGKGVKKPYEKARKYAKKHGGRVEDWQHAKGIGTVDYYGEYRDAELHWSQCDGYGKHDFFIKRWLE